MKSKITTQGHKPRYIVRKQFEDTWYVIDTFKAIILLITNHKYAACRLRQKLNNQQLAGELEYLQNKY
jgi:hypothetical protein